MSDKNQSDYWQIIEPIWYDEKLNNYCPEIYLARFDELTEPQKTLFPTYWLVSDICNGGFHQCFWNMTGLYAPEAVLGFQKLDLHKTAKIVQKAINIFDEPFPREQEVRQDFLDEFDGEGRKKWDPFFKLDDKFYESLMVDGFSQLEKDGFEIAANNYAKEFLI